MLLTKSQRMKIIINLLLYSISGIVFSQSNGFIIQTKGSDTIKTDWMELKSYPFFQKPYIKIDNEQGKIIFLDKIDFAEGYDQNSNFTMLKTFPVENDIQFTQWKHIEAKNGQLTLYQDQLIFGVRNSFPKEILKEYYSYSSSSFKKLNYQHVRHDLKIMGVSNREIKSAKSLIIIQRVSQLIGVALLADIIISNSSNVSAEFMKNTNNDKFYLSACLIVVPISLNGLKKNLLRQSLHNAFGR